MKLSSGWEVSVGKDGAVLFECRSGATVDKLATREARTEFLAKCDLAEEGKISADDVAALDAQKAELLGKLAAAAADVVLAPVALDVDPLNEERQADVVQVTELAGAIEVLAADPPPVVSSFVVPADEWAVLAKQIGG